VLEHFNLFLKKDPKDEEKVLIYFPQFVIDFAQAQFGLDHQVILRKGHFSIETGYSLEVIGNNSVLFRLKFATEFHLTLGDIFPFLIKDDFSCSTIKYENTIPFVKLMQNAPEYDLKEKEQELGEFLKGNNIGVNYPCWSTNDWPTLLQNMKPGNLYHPASKSSSADLYFFFEQRKSTKKQQVKNSDNVLVSPPKNTKKKRIWKKQLFIFSMGSYWKTYFFRISRGN